ncbi:small integral membrane protein 3 isoform X1 [Colius striatus]|uniref:small integral membrane protein 3 isoform X1 n=2 Tax=Colius striatus TaxID=57412 RepID=UPI002B1D8D47|nr:small integral membrane protein 3 isoform X1 [Colius striatus]
MQLLCCEISHLGSSLAPKTTGLVSAGGTPSWAGGDPLECALAEKRSRRTKVPALSRLASPRPALPSPPVPPPPCRPPRAAPRGPGRAGPCGRGLPRRDRIAGAPGARHGRRMDLPDHAGPAAVPKHILDVWVIVLIILATILIMTALVLCPATAVIIYRIRTHPMRNGIV